MIKFLEELGISSSVIDKIIEINGDSIIYDFNNSSKNIIEIINYLKDIGVKNIDGLLIEETDLFFKQYEDIKFKIEKFGVKEAVLGINNDLIFIEDIIA